MRPITFNYMISRRLQHGKGRWKRVTETRNHQVTINAEGWDDPRVQLLLLEHVARAHPGWSLGGWCERKETPCDDSVG